MGLFSKIKKTLNPKNVLNPVKAIKTAHENTKSLVSQDSRNIRSLAKLFGGSSTGSGWASSLYREADHNVHNPMDAIRKAAISAATWYVGGAAGAWAGSAGASAGLTAAQQAALSAAAQGATQGGLSAAANGGNIWRGALTGGLTGGLGAYAGPAISGYTGMPSWAGNALGRAGTGALGAGLSGGNPWAGAAAGGIGSLASSGLNALGAPGFLSSMGGRLAGNLAGGLAAGAGGSGGGGGYGGSGYGGSGAPSSAGRVGSGMSGGYGGPVQVPGSLWKDPVTLAEQGDQAYVDSTYKPIQAEWNRQQVADALTNDSDFIQKVRENPDWLRA